MEEVGRGLNTDEARDGRDYMRCGDVFRIGLDKPGTREMTARVVRGDIKKEKGGK